MASVTIEVTDSLIRKLKTLAERQVDTDNPDFTAFDYQDGPDGAWDGGNEDGETQNARMVLDALGVEYTTPVYDPEY